MRAFDYTDSADPVREDLAESYRRIWHHIAAPGTWLTGAERVAVAEETRRARDCSLCAERKAALSPFTIKGEHDQTGRLSASMVDEIHRVTTDAARLSQDWHDSLLKDGLSDEAYVEALGIVVLMVSIDAFHQAMGLTLEPLPEPEPGEPSQYRPLGAVEGEAWVPMLDPKQATEDERKMIAKAPGGDAPYILRALSLVPDQVRALLDLHESQYLSPEQMGGFKTGRALIRPQMELIAARVSALNECFYRTSSHSVMLRASINYHGLDGNLQVVTEGAEAGESGVPHGEQLIAFAEAAVKGDVEELARARDALRTAAGSEALVDAAGVIGNFQRQVRIADGTGIPLDGVIVGASDDFRQEIGINDFQTRRQAELGPIARVAAPLLRGAMKVGLRAVGWRSRKA